MVDQLITVFFYLSTTSQVYLKVITNYAKSSNLFMKVGLFAGRRVINAKNDLFACAWLVKCHWPVKVRIRNIENPLINLLLQRHLKLQHVLVLLLAFVNFVLLSFQVQTNHHQVHRRFPSIFKNVSFFSKLICLRMLKRNKSSNVFKILLTLLIKNLINT